MAFTRNTWSRQSVALNTGIVGVQGGPAIFSYRSVGDNSAAIAGADYFADAVYDLSVDDLLHCQGSDTFQVLSVATIDRAAGTITTSSTGIASSIGTSNIIDDAVTSAKLSPLMMKYVAVAITAAQFNGMYVAPKLLVAAEGADTLLVLDRVQLVLTYDSAAYAAGGVAAVQYDSTVNGAGIIASTTMAASLFQGTASETFNMNPGVVDQPFSTSVNKGLYLSNITQAFTTGDSDMVAHVWYKVIPTV